jgi:endonuclease YncB( thermonuclease family)
VAVAQQQPSDEQSCTLQGGPTRSVIRVIDAETVLLDDNQEVRLVGALAPRSPDLSPSAQPWRPEEEATAALRALVLGRSVSLATSGREADRYGRKLAHLFIERDGERVWVQGELLTGGHARVYGLPGSYACMRELLAHERVARDAVTGLWANAAYAVRASKRTRELNAGAIPTRSSPALSPRSRRRKREPTSTSEPTGATTSRRASKHACCAPILNGPRHSARWRESASRCAAG